MIGQPILISISGLPTVSVTDTPLEGNRPGREIEARAGETVVRLRHTFGAADGPRPQVTVEQLQADLDAARQRAATEAAWREDVRIKVEQLK